MLCDNNRKLVMCDILGVLYNRLDEYVNLRF